MADGIRVVECAIGAHRMGIPVDIVASLHVSEEVETVAGPAAGEPECSLGRVSIQGGAPTRAADLSVRLGCGGSRGGHWILTTSGTAWRVDRVVGLLRAHGVGRALPGSPTVVVHDDHGGPVHVVDPA